MKGICRFCEVVLVLAIAASTRAVPTDRAIVDRFVEMYGLDTATHQVELVSCDLKTATVLPQHVQIRPLTQKEPLGVFSAIVRIEENGEEIESGQVRLNIHRYADVLVANDNLQRLESKLAEQCVLRRMEITNVHERPLTDPAELAGKRSKRNIPRGTILTAGAFEPVPDIETGRDVSITYTDGIFQITAAGTALQAGMAGEYIRVKNKISGKIIMARVVDNALVAIDP